jgi:hypothetical protein
VPIRSIIAVVPFLMAGYVATREGEEDVAVVTEANVGADGALELRLLEEGDGDTGVRGNEVAEFSDIAIETRIEGRELGDSAVRVHLPLTDRDGDVRDAGVGEGGSLGVVGRGFDVGELESRRGDTDDDSELAEGLLLFLVGEGEARPATMLSCISSSLRTLRYSWKYRSRGA